MRRDRRDSDRERGGDRGGERRRGPPDDFREATAGMNTSKLWANVAEPLKCNMSSICNILVSCYNVTIAAVTQ